VDDASTSWDLAVAWGEDHEAYRSDAIRLVELGLKSKG
jgi:hypothetical protein